MGIRERIVHPGGVGVFGQPTLHLAESHAGTLVERPVAQHVVGDAGVPLGIGVKRLLVTILAASTIALADVSDEDVVKLGAVYVAVACGLVLLPVAVYVVAGPRADDLVATTKSWLTTNQQAVVRVALLAFGGLLAVDAIVSLA